MFKLAEANFVAEIKKNWTCIQRWIVPLSFTWYSVWLSPDAEFFVGIHEADNEIFMVQKISTGEIGIPIRDVMRVLRIAA